MATNKQAEKYKDLGNDEFRKGEFGKAIENYTYATEIDPRNPVYFTNRSMCYFKMKEYEKSLRDAKKAISIDPNWAKGYCRAGTAELELGNYKEALANLQKAAEIDPKTTAYAEAAADAKRRMYANLSPAEISKLEGNEFFKIGEIDKAIEKYTLAITQVKGHDEKSKQILADIYSNRAMCHQQRWDSKEVVSDASAAIGLVPNHAKAIVRRAQAYESLEKYKESLADFELAARLQPGMDVAHKGAVRIRQTLRRVGEM